MGAGEVELRFLELPPHEMDGAENPMDLALARVENIRLLDLLQAPLERRGISNEERPLEDGAGEPRIRQRIRGIERHRPLEHLDGARVVLERVPVMVVLAAEEAIVRREALRALPARVPQ